MADRVNVTYPVTGVTISVPADSPQARRWGSVDAVTEEPTGDSAPDTGTKAQAGPTTRPKRRTTTK